MYENLLNCHSGMAYHLYAGLPMAVVLSGPADEILFANDEFFALTECTEPDLALMSFQDVLSLFCLTLHDSLKGFLDNSGIWYDVDKPIAKADGSLAWVRVRVDALEIPDCGPCSRLLIDDISRYKVAMEGLLNRKNLYQSIVETRPDLICCFMPNGSITYANTALSRFFGTTRSDMIGKNILTLLDPGLRDRFSQAMDSIGIAHPMTEIEYRCAGYDPDDPPLWTRWVIQGFFYKTGHIKDFQAVGLDVTGQKETESQFIHADRLVSLGRLVSEVAHEISNPNNFIMLNAPLVLDLWRTVAPSLETLAKDIPDGRLDGVPVTDITRHVPQLLQGVIEGSERIRDFVRELKNFARKDAESGFETLSVNDVVQSSILLMSKTIGLHTSRFSVNYGAGLPLVRGRRQRLEQVIVNLLQNACHALLGPHQSIEVQTFFHEPTSTVRMAVRDEGVGIRSEDLSRVTEPFYSTKRQEGGTGLGLSISLSIAREHGGELILESIPGKGTTAMIALPANIQDMVL